MAIKRLYIVSTDDNETADKSVDLTVVTGLGRLGLRLRLCLAYMLEALVTG